MVIRRGCGDRDLFEFTGGAYVTPNDGVRGQLTEHADGSFSFHYYHGRVDHFDAEGRLAAEVDRNGNRHEFLYEDGGDGSPDKFPLIGTSPRSVDPNRPMVVAYHYRLARIQERAADGTLTGNAVDFAYNEATGRLSAITASDGRSVGYVHDQTASATRGNLERVDGLEGIVSTFGYQDSLPDQPDVYRDDHNLTHIQHAQGETTIVNTYDDNDRVISQARGHALLSFDYSAPRIESSVTRTIADPNGNLLHTATTTYQFDSDGFITQETDALGNQMRYAYDNAKNRISAEQWDNSSGTLVLRKTTGYGYNVQGDRILESVTLDSGEIITRSWSYDQGWVTCEQTVSSAAPDQVFRTDYSLIHDSDGVPVNVQAIARLIEATTTNDDDGDGLLTCADSVDGTWQTTAFTYDTQQRLRVTTLPDGVEIHNDYQNSLYVTRTYYKDSNGTELAHLQRRFGYDGQGNRTDEWDAKNNHTQTDYDDLGRLRSRTNAGGEQTLYDYTGRNLTLLENGRTAADGEGQVTRFTYDGDNNRTQIERKDESGDFILFEQGTYDTEGNRLSLTDGEGRATTFAYDALNRLRSTTDALQNTQTFAYDAAGNLGSVPDRTISYGHDLNGNVTNLADDAVQPLGQPLYGVTYDPLDRPDLVTIGYIPNAAISLDHDYDRYGNRSTLILDDGEQLVHQYDYDKRDRLVQADLPGAQHFTLTYYDNDDPKRVSYPSGITRDYSYFDNGPVQDISIQNSSAQPIEVLAYTYDDVLNVDTQTDSDGLHDYDYDDLDRLIEAIHPAGVGLPQQEELAYDLVGNREDPGDPDLYNYDANNRILQSPGLTYGFDDDGSQISKSDGSSFTYDAYNRLIAFSKGGTSASYAYSPQGQRLRKQVGVQITYFLWDGGRLLGEYDGGGNRIKRYAYLPGDYLPVQTADAGGVYDVHGDHLQTPRMLTDAGQSAVWRSRLEAFGGALVEEDVDGDGAGVTFNIRFPGQYFDDESGLHYNYFRDYDPTTGRYIEGDPIGLAGGLNTYAYVGNNPLRFIDPTGEINFEPPIDPNNPVVDPNNLPKPVNSHTDPSLRPERPIPPSPRPTPDKPSKAKAADKICKAILRPCLAGCASPICAHPAAKVACITACWAAYFACVGLLSL